MIKSSVQKILMVASKKIRAERIALELSQEEFANFVDIKYATYKTFEQKGKITFENYVKILIKINKEKKEKKLTHVCIVGDNFAHLHIQMSFPHVFHMFSTFPHFLHKVFHIFGAVIHIFQALFHTFSTFFGEFSTFFWSFPHFTNIHIFAYSHIFMNFQRLYIQNAKYKK